MSVFVSLMLLQAAAAAPVPQQATAKLPDDQKVLCKTLVGTGSRLNSQRVCMTKLEWKKLNQGGEDFTREMQNRDLTSRPDGY
jgi:hypothetical protein